MTNYNFSSKIKHANVFSIILFLISIILIFFKGLNYGINVRQIRGNFIGQFFKIKFCRTNSMMIEKIPCPYDSLSKFSSRMFGLLDEFSGKFVGTSFIKISTGYRATGEKIRK